MNTFRKQFVLSAFLLVALFDGTVLAQVQPLPIDSIIKARITADGNVSGRGTDFLINLGVPRDNSDGLTLPAGHRMEIILPPEFVNNRQVTNVNTGMTTNADTETVFTSNACTIGNFVCNTSVFVQGWPQRPIATVLPTANKNSPDDFQFNTPVYLLSTGDTENVFVHEAQMEVRPGSAPPGPGIKQIHMILPGFSIPEVQVPTDFPITVRETRVIENDEIEILREGTAPFTVIPETQPSINLTSVFDPMRRNTVYQEVAFGEDPLPYEFYLWDGDGGSFTGVRFDGLDVLDESQNKIGRITITGPEGAAGQALAAPNPSTDIDGGDVFFNRPTARLTAQFTPGGLAGDYVTTIEMFSKDDIGMVNPTIVSTEMLTVNVVPEPTSFGLSLLATCGLGLALRRKRVGRTR